MFRNGFQQHLVFQLRFKMALTNEAEILQNFRTDQYVNLCDYNFIYLLSIFVLMVMSLKKLESISCVHLITILSLSQPLLYLEKADLLTELRRVFTWNLWLIFQALGKVFVFLAINVMLHMHHSSIFLRKQCNRKSRCHLQQVAGMDMPQSMMS